MISSAYSNSIIGFITIFITLLILSFIAVYAKIQGTKKFCLVCIVLILSFIAGFRALSVGRDTLTYYNSTFLRITNGNFFRAHGSLGYSSFILVLSKIKENYNFILFVVALITYSLIIFRLWELREDCNFIFMMYIFLTSWYFLSLNVTRQFFSLSIVFFAIRFIPLKRYKTYVFLILLASTIHTISIIGFIVAIIYFMVRESTISEKNNWMRMFVVIIALVVLYPFIYSFGMRYFDFAHYMDLAIRNRLDEIDIGYMQPLKTALIIFFSYMLKKEESNYAFIDNNVLVCDSLFTEEVVIRRKIIAILALFGVSLSMVDYLYENASRVVWVFQFFEIPFYSILYDNMNTRKLSYLLFGVLALYTFYSELSGNGNHVLPYYFCWSK